MIRKFLLSAFFVLMASVIHAYDFYESNYGNYVALEYVGCDEKIVRGNTIWLRGKFSVIPFHHVAAGWNDMGQSSTGDISTGNFVYFKLLKSYDMNMSFYLSLNIYTLSDNRAPDIHVSSRHNFIDSKFLAHDEAVIDFRVDKDLSDNNSRGCGIRNVSYSIDGGEYRSVSCSDDGVSFSVSVKGSGIHSVSVRATDNVGNTSTVSRSILIDNEKPELFCTVDGMSGLWTESPVSISCTSKDSLTGINENAWQIFLDGESIGKSSSNNSIYINEEWNKDIVFCTEDFAGNQTFSKPFNVRIDRMPPEISVSDSTMGKWSPSAKIYAVASDLFSGVNENSWKKYLDGNAETGNTFEFSGEGIHEVYFSVEDNMGHFAQTDSLTVSVDSVKPVIEDFSAITKSNEIVPKIYDGFSGINESSVRWTIGNEWTMGRKAILPEGIYSITFYCEDLAGNSSDRSGRVIIDGTPPEINFSIEEYEGSYFLELKDFDARDLISDKVILSYSMDGEDFVPFWKDSEDKIKFPVDYLLEGKHKLVVRGEDTHDNETIIENEFIVDRTPPKINSVEFMSNGFKLENGDFIQPTDGMNFYLDISVNSSDMVGEETEGKVSQWACSVNNGSFKITESMDFRIEDFVSGRNDVRIKVIDGAGNESSVLDFYFNVDTTIPLEPRIKCKTHKKAIKVTDSVRNDSPQFELSVASSDDNGIRGFFYSLYTCCLDEYGFPADDSLNICNQSNRNFIECNNRSELIFSKLDDNKPGEFYLLKCSALSMNGMESPETIYTFRIDMTPPENLSLWLWPHVDENLWYNQKNIRLEWFPGIDSSKIFCFKWALTDDDSELPDENWNVIQDCLCTEKWISTEGEKTIRFRSCDSAGNFSEEKKSVKIDSVKPLFENDSFVCKWKGNDCAEIMWPKAMDYESGIDSIEIDCIELDGGKIKTSLFKNEKKSGKVRKLDDSKDYRIVLSAYDKAGNKSSMTMILPAKDSIKDSFVYRYSEDFFDYKIEGIVKSNVDGRIICFMENPELTVPESIGLFSDGIKRKKILMDKQTAFFENGIIKSFESTAGNYSVLINGEKFDSEKIMFDIKKGMELQDASYTQKNLYSENLYDKELKFDYVNFGIEEQINVNSSMEFFEEDYFFMPDKIIFSGINGMVVSDNKKFFTGNLKADFKKLDVRSLNNEKSIKINGLNSEINNKDSFAYIGEKILYRMNEETELEIEKGFIHENNLCVEKSMMKIKSEDNEFILHMDNFVLDEESGKCVSEDYKIYLTDSIGNILNKFIGEGIGFDSDKIRIDGNRIVASGSLISDRFANLELNELCITNSGIDFSNASIVESEMYVHGFKVRAKKSSLTKDPDFGLVLKIIEGNLFAFGQAVPVKNLFLPAYGQKEVAGVCEVFDSFKANLGYGAFIDFINGLIDDSGISFRIHVPVSDDSYIEFSDVGIHSDGTISNALVDNAKLNLNGFVIDGECIKFDGNTIQIMKGLCNVSSLGLFDGKDIVPNLDFKELEFNFNRIVSSGIFSCNELSYSYEDWIFNASNFFFNEDGIGCKCRTDISTMDSVLSAEFDRFTLLANGTFDSGFGNDNPESNFVTNSGYRINMPKCAFEKNSEGDLSLFSDRPSTFIETESGGRLIQFGKTWVTNKLKFEGKIFRQNEIVLTEWGKLAADSFMLCDDGICMSGLLKFSKMLGEMFSKKPNFVLKADSALNTLSSADSFKWNAGSWIVSSSEGKILGKEILSDSSMIDFCGKQINLGNIRMNSSQEIYSAVFGDMNQTIDLAGFNAKLLEAYVSKNGISVAACLGFSLGEKLVETFFDKIELFSDGTWDASESNGSNENVKIGDSMYRFENIRLVERGLSFSKSVLDFFDTEKFSVSSGTGIISSDGIIESNEFLSGFFEKWDCFIFPEKMQIKSSSVVLSGFLMLPANAPGILSCAIMHIKDMEISSSGQLLSMEVESGLSDIIPLFGDLNLYYSGLKFIVKDTVPYLSFTSCGLIFPQNLMVSSAAIKEMRFNLETGKFDFDEINLATDLEALISGIRLSMRKIIIDDSFSISMSGFACFEDERFPEFIRNTIFPDVRIKISSEGELLEIYAKTENVDGSILSESDVMNIENGTLEILKKENDSLYINASGIVRFSENAPEGLQNLEFGVNTLTYDTGAHCLSELDSQLDVSSSNICGLELEDLSARIHWTEDTERKISFSGKLVMPECFPKEVAGTKIDIRNFTIDCIDGSCCFNASYDFDRKFNLYKGIYLYDSFFDFDYCANEINIGLKTKGGLEKNLFPQGIGGLEVELDIHANANEIKSIDGEAELHSIKIFDTLDAENLSLKICKEENRNAVISMSGLFHFSEIGMFKGLDDVDINVNEINFSSSGEILSADGNAECSSFTLFDAIEISDSHFSIGCGNTNDLVFSVCGGIKIVANGIPDALKTSQLYLDKLSFSSQSGLIDFKAGLESTLKYRVLDGLDLYLNSLTIGKDGLSFSALAKMNFCAGIMDGVVFSLDMMSMNWNGIITEIRGGMEHSVIEIAGFYGEISGLRFQKDENLKDGFFIELDDCRLRLPENFGSIGGEFIALKNASFKNGSFNGTLAVSNLQTKIAGFTLYMKEPEIAFDTFEIKAERIGLICPEMILNAEIELRGVEVSSVYGLRFKGGKFTLPDFKLKEVTFRRVTVEFCLDGNSYGIGGGGYVDIPNAGEFGAYLTFTNACSEYPIGLKRAYFSYEVPFPSRGIPLGNTGLFITCLRGGLAYGYPEEVPVNLRSMFGSGARIQLGLKITDISDSLVDINADTWINVENIAWAFSGDTTLLKGTFNLSGNVESVLSKYGFYTGMEVNVVFVIGNVSLFIFDHYGSVKFSGSANACFFIPKGSILTWNINFWFFDISIYIPPFPIWFGPIGADFGDFTNGARGFKAYGNFLGFQFGVVFSTYGFTVGNVSHYNLYSPSMVWWKKALAADNLSVDELMNGYENEIRNSFVMPEKTEKAVFVCAWAEGDPEIYVKSPSGKIFRPETPGTEIHYFDNYLTFAVGDPEAGEWTLKIENAPPEYCVVDMLTSRKRPGVEIRKFQCKNGILEVNGKTDEINSKICVEIQNEENKIIQKIGECTANDFGEFSLKCSLGNLIEGKCRARVSLIEGEEKIIESEWTESMYEIEYRTESLMMPKEFRAWRRGNEIYIAWNDPNGFVSDGVSLFVKSSENNFAEETKINCGFVKSFVLHGILENEELEISACSYSESGLKSERTKSIHIPKESEYRKLHSDDSLKIGNDVIELKMTSDKMIERKTSFKISEGNIPGRYYFAEVESSEGNSLSVAFYSHVKENDGNVEIEYALYPSENLEPGNYSLKGFLYVEDNAELKAPFVMNIEVIEPTPEIKDALPKILQGNQENSVCIFGIGLESGCEFYLDNEILELSEKESSFGNSVEVIVPPQKTGGNKKLTAKNIRTGETSFINLDVLLPDYALVAKTNSLKIEKGTAGYFPVSVKRMNEHNAPIILSKSMEQEKIIVDFPDAVEDNFFEVSVFVPENSTEDFVLFKIETDEEKTLTVPVEIVNHEENARPSINCIEPVTAHIGDKVSIYGYGFDETSEIILDGEKIIPTHNERGKLVFIAEENMKTGSISVRTKNGESEKKKFYMRKNYLQITTGTDCIEINGVRDSSCVFHTEGNEDSVVFGIEKSPDVPAVFTFSDNAVSCGDRVKLSVTPLADAKNGEWEFTVTAKGRRCMAFKTMKLKITGRDGEDKTKPLEARKKQEESYMESEKEILHTLTNVNLCQKVYESSIKNGKILTNEQSLVIFHEGNAEIVDKLTSDCCMLSFEAPVSSIVFCQNRLIFRLENEDLVSVDKHGENESIIHSVESISTDGETLIIRRNKVNSIYDPETLVPIKETGDRSFTVDRTLWKNQICYAFSGKEMYTLYPENKVTDLSDKINFVQKTDIGFIAVQDKKVTVLDDNLNVLHEIHLDTSNIHDVISLDNKLLFASFDSIFCYNLNIMNMEWDCRMAGVRKLLHYDSNFIVVTDSLLYIFSEETGSKVCEMDFSVYDATTSDDGIYFSDYCGNIFQLMNPDDIF